MAAIKISELKYLCTRMSSFLLLDHGLCHAKRALRWLVERRRTCSFLTVHPTSERCLSTKDHSGRARGRIWHGGPKVQRRRVHRFPSVTGRSRRMRLCRRRSRAWLTQTFNHSGTDSGNRKCAARLGLIVREGRSGLFAASLKMRRSIQSAGVISLNSLPNFATMLASVPQL
jgi:hypothetical protein